MNARSRMIGIGVVNEQRTNRTILVHSTQVTAMGPLGLQYLSAKDDPRNSSDRSNRTT